MAQVLEGSGERQVVGLRGRGQDVVHPLRSLYSGTGEERGECSQDTWEDDRLRTGKKPSEVTGGQRLRGSTRNGDATELLF